MSGLLTPPYGVMETGSNNDSEYEKLDIRWWASKQGKERKGRMEILLVWVLNFKSLIQLAITTALILHVVEDTWELAQLPSQLYTSVHRVFKNLHYDPGLLSKTYWMMLCSILLLVLHEPWNTAMSPASKINVTNCINFF